MSRPTAFPGILIVLVALPLLADARDSYRRGMEAIEREDWLTAAEEMRRAIGERPQESAGAFRRYLPHYYRGLALFELGDCSDALDEWAESVRQGAIAGSREMSTIRTNRRVCAQREAVTPTTVRNQVISAGLGDQIRRAEAVAAHLAQIQLPPELASFWEEGSPPRSERLEEATRLLDSAREVASDPTQVNNRDLLRRAELWAISARQRMESFLEQAGASRPGIQDSPSQAVEARELLASVTVLEPLPDELAKITAKVRQLLENTERETDPATASLDPSDRLEESLADLRAAAAPPPEELLKAARAYLRADHLRVLELLAEVDFGTDRELAHSHLLLAAARYALFFTGEAADHSLLERARTDVLACQELDGTLTPTDDRFSPRFVEFFTLAGR